MLTQILTQQWMSQKITGIENTYQSKINFKIHVKYVSKSFC